MNNVLPLTLLLSVVINHATPLHLKCYQCSGVDEASCMRVHRNDSCPNYVINPVCISLVYTRMLKVSNESAVIEQTHQKKCVSGVHGCQYWCNTLQNVKFCNAKCCRSNFCNGPRLNNPPGAQTGASTTHHIPQFMLLFLTTIPVMAALLWR